ncbi:MAG TPA: 50S ribosomal protein L13 [Cytophagales bacterium]|nr:50S ribosomal protein L13 [Cytophagales bacterium]
MDSLSYKTTFVNKQSAEKGWVVVDAENQIVGRLASEIAKIIRGKHKASFTPNADCGDNVIVINASKVRFTGKKLSDKVYTRHTGYTGGQRFTTPKEVLAKKPNFILENAVKHMLPKNRLGRQLFNNLFIYAESEHPHTAQQPKEVKF